MTLKKLPLICGALILGLPLIGSSQQVKDHSGEYRKILTAVAAVIQNKHVSPAPFNDNLSEQWWKQFLETLDPQKQFFLQSDLDALNKFRTGLDDELRGEKNLRFLPAVQARYQLRIKEAGAQYSKLLNQPFNFNREEYIRQDGSGSDVFAKNSGELTESRRRYVKYQVLQKLVQLQKHDTLSRSEAQLEEEARQKVLVKMEKLMGNKNADAQPEKLFSVYLNCFTHLMDPHTTYLSVEEAKKLRDRLSNKVAGIGASLAADEEGAKIMRLENTGAAALNGLEMNDVIVRLGEGETGAMTELTGLPPGEIANMVRGEKGSSLRLEVKKPDGTLVIVSLQRSELNSQETAVKALVVQRKDKKIGYITFPIFYQDVNPFGPQVSADVAQAISLLKEKKVDAILFDLRRNGGGSLQEVTRMVSLLIKGGPVLQIRERNHAAVPRSIQDVMAPLGNKPVVQQVYDGPLAVLVDEFSASASEIFAAAIQDYKRGVIIGSASTYGKGTVQRGELLGNGTYGILNLTFSRFYRVSGASTQQRGVVPDIILPDLNKCVKSGEKDLGASLLWDMVAPATYEACSGDLDLDRLRKFAARRMENDTAFSIITKNAAKICAQSTKDIPLKIDAYKQMLNEQEAITAQNIRLLKLPAGKELDLDVLYPLKNEIFINGIRKDIYIDQAVAIAAEMCK
jgi:carboxyl-terminal processing protease